MTSSEVELMETPICASSVLSSFLLTSSEVELMETLRQLGQLAKQWRLLTSSEVELMETCLGASF